MKKITKLILITMLLLTAGCDVLSKNIVGNQKRRIDTKACIGKWVELSDSTKNDTIEISQDSIDQNVLKFSWKSGSENIMVHITHCDSIKFFNFIFKDFNSKGYYTWGIFEQRNDTIFMQYPDKEKFTKAILQKKLAGIDISKYEADSKPFKNATSILLTDKSDKITNFIKTRKKISEYFQNGNVFKRIKSSI